MRDNLNVPVTGEINRPNTGGAKRILGPWVDQPGRLEAFKNRMHKPLARGLHRRSKPKPYLKHRKMS